MKKVIVTFLLSIIVITGFSQNVCAEDPKEVELLFFYGKGCPHCSKAKTFFEDISSQYPLLKVSEYETYSNQENALLFQYLANAFDTEVEGVPTVFIDNKVIVGFNDAIADSLEQEIQRCSKHDCGSPLSKLEKLDSSEITKISAGSSPSENPETESLKKKLTIPAVISAAAVDAVNPCAFAVLIILLTTILASKNKKRALFAGLAFSSSIFISYFLMGIGLYSAIQAAKFTHTFYIIVSILAILVGLFNLKDYFAYGKWFVMEVPMSWRPKMKSLIKGVTSVPGAFLIGFVVSLFLLPCTSGPYIVILGLLASVTERTYATLMLFLYNFIFIVPMLVITGAVFFGFTNTDKAEKWRKKKLRVLHLIAGLIILALGIGMIIALSLGYI
ncbi:hypothetical protein GF354_06690 [Candidatus Peregrinibacteria bacterium]|nr:hypothetical protein [Candidatus Peregrinibacteria bacterium]